MKSFNEGLNMKCALKESERAELLLRNTSQAATNHFEQCSSCRRVSLEQAALWQAMDSWNVRPVSSGFNRSLYAKIEAVAHETWYERLAASVRPLFAQPAWALGMAGALFAAGFVFDHQATREHQTTIQVSTTEAEQVEKTLDDLEMLRQFDLVSEEKGTASKTM